MAFGSGPKLKFAQTEEQRNSEQSHEIRAAMKAVVKKCKQMELTVPKANEMWCKQVTDGFSSSLSFNLTKADDMWRKGYADNGRERAKFGTTMLQ